MHEQLSVISALHFQLCTLRPALQFAPLNSRYRHAWFRPECDCLSLHVLSMEHAFSPEFGGFLYIQNGCLYLPAWKMCEFSPCYSIARHWKHLLGYWLIRPYNAQEWPYNAHGIGNYSCQIFNKKVDEIDKKCLTEWLRKLRTSYRLLYLNHDRGLYVDFHRSGLSFCKIVRQE